MYVIETPVLKSLPLQLIKMLNESYVKSLPDILQNR